MLKATCILLSVLAYASTLGHLANALEFEMQTQMKCIYEEINSNVIVVGDYKAFNKDHPDAPQIVDVRVRSASDLIIYSYINAHVLSPSSVGCFLLFSNLP